MNELENSINFLKEQLIAAGEKWKGGIRQDDYNDRLHSVRRWDSFSSNGVHYEGTIQQIGGKRSFVVNERMRIGGIGGLYLMKD
ncbi:hypothetical protein [Heyndrickxia faecalis]|uniref:hypothetical protein n=1 Tax=Heyndrickxia faecalis TaxID=2824910 RepID=UPI003D23D065